MKKHWGSGSERSRWSAIADRWVVAMIFGCLAVAPAATATVYVKQDASGASDGTSWSDAYTTLTTAAAHLADGDAVWVAKGTYTNTSSEITISTANVAIYGGFAGTETLLSQRDTASNPTVVDGNNAYRCFNITAANVTLDGLTLQRGWLNSDNGAGINNSGANLVVNHCTIAGCAIRWGDHRGGGIYSSDSMQVLNSALVGNTNSVGGNSQGGGGIAFDSTGTLLVSNTVFRGNVAIDENAGDSTSYGVGGGIQMVKDGQLTAVNCVFDGNGSLHNEAGKSRRGGAIYLRHTSAGNASIVNCTFYGNTVPRGNGGAIYSAGTPLYVTNCIFWGNTATADSGPNLGQQIYSERSTVSIGYSCFPGTSSTDISAGGTLITTNLVTSDPLFADAAGHDFHLQSAFGRWTSGGWVTDAATSPCIDAGNPASPYGNEPAYNGSRVNLGADGNTTQASKSEGSPVVDNAAVTYVAGQTVATLNGTLTSIGGEQPGVWVYWGPSDGTTNDTGWANTNYFGQNAAALPAAYATNVTVALGTTYYYRYKAANAYGTNWASSSASFATVSTTPEVTIQATDAAAAELGSDPGVFTVTRTDIQTNLALTVHFTITGTAVNGTDYTTLGTSATIPAGALSTTVTVTPLYDALNTEGDETVILTLATDAAYTIGTPDNATVTIADNASAGTLVYVNRSVAGGTHDGTSWANACTTLTDALARVANGGALWVAKGTYTNSADLAVATPSISIYGGFAGTETLLSQRDTASNPTVVDGNNAYRCFNITAANVTLDGLTLRRGRAGGHGGGINNAGANLVLNGCTVSNCGATGDNRGGGIYSSQSMQVLNSLMVGNTNSLNANGQGGGAIAFDSTGNLLVSNTVFRGNKANDTSAGDATSYGAGGAIEMIQAGLLTAINCVFDGNAALHNETGKDRRGGAIYLKASSGGSGRFVNCTFYGNYVVRGFGGAIYSSGSPLYVTNCILWGNTSTANSGSQVGQQIYSEGGLVSIGYGCFPGTGTTDIYAGGTLVTTNLVTSDPLFADAASHDFHLQSAFGRWTSGGWVNDAATSPCIDAGNTASPYGNESFYNGGRIDLGAYGNTAQASLSDASPAVSNAAVTYIAGQTTATLNGLLTYSGAAQPEVWVYWGPTDGTTNDTGWANTNYFGQNAAALPAAYATNVTVALGTTYYYRYKVASAYGTNWASPSVTFDTLSSTPTVTIQATDAAAAELGSDPGVFTITRTAVQTNVALTVHFVITGTAVNGTDYTTLGTSAIIPAGALSTTVTVTPLYDALTSEGDETVILTLATDAAYTIGTPDNATVTVADNASAGTLVYVNRSVAGGAHDGATWASACTTLTDALARVANGGALWVAKGTYTNSADLAVATPSISIYGGFAGTETLLSQRDTASNPTVVDGNNAYRCFSITAANVTLDGLTLQRGRTSGDGGGINSAGANLVLNGCTVINCGATGDNRGGGIYSSQSMQVLNSLMVGNTNSLNANGQGGGAIAFDSTGNLLVSNTVFRGNKANDINAGDATSYGAGGAIEMIQAGLLTAINCVFDGNAALHNETGKDRRGGAIYLKASSGGSGRFVNCTFYGNYVVRGFGGAIYSSGSPLYVTNCILWGNTSTANSGSQVGQQIYSEGGLVSIGYGCFPGTGTTDISAGGTLSIGTLITRDPQFADAAGHDFHLRSGAGRWTSGGWVNDSGFDSPCIDAGDPASDYASEPLPNGHRVNLGAYGNTPQASKTMWHGAVFTFR